MKFDKPAGENPIDQLKVVGRPHDRIDGPLKTTGTARYAYEWHEEAPNAAYGYIVGSAIAKGRLTALDTDAAQKAPGVLAVITASNAGALGKGDKNTARLLGGPTIEHYHQAIALWHKPEQAFLTDDHRTILRFAVEALMSGKGAVLVTLVEIRGGAARPLGAQMVVREDGRYCGFVSGGCVEAAAAFEALEMMGSGRDREIRYGEGSPWFDIVLPCGGGITLTLHKLRSAQPLLAVLNRLEQRKPAGLRYDPQAQSLVCLPTQTRTGWNLNGFEVGFRPCVRLMIYGRSLEAQATASLAAATGYDSHIFDLFPASASAQIDTDTAVILLCHDLNRELPVLQAAREAKPFYLGALGSHRTHTLRLQKLHELGWSREETAQIRAPVGIFPKARDAHTLALSVLAEIASVRLHQEEDSCLPPSS